jgi:anti-anti-sigma factor
MATVSGRARATMSVSEVGEGTLVVSVAGELDLDTVTGLEKDIAALLERPATAVRLDLGALAFVDSSGLGLLLRIANHFGPLVVLGASASVRRLVEVTGLGDVLHLDDGAP